MIKRLRILSLALVIIAAVGFLLLAPLNADTATPGTVNDPLVTKSYVDLKVAELQDAIGGLGELGLNDEAEGISNDETEALNMQEIEAYVDDQIAKALAELEMTGSIETDNGEEGGISLSEDETDSNLFAVVGPVQPGMKIICGASAELILRAGSAQVIAGANGDGLANLTEGSDLAGGAEVPAQHHLLVSRDDGRGFQITGDNSYVLVKGDYTLE